MSATTTASDTQHNNGRAKTGAEAWVEARAAGEAVRQEDALHATRSLAEGQRHVAREAVRNIEAVGHKVAHAAQETSETMRQLMTLPHAAGGGIQDMRHGMAGLFEGIAQTNLHAAREMFRLANPAAIVGWQQRFMADYMDTMMRGTATLLRAVRRAADETLPPLEAGIERNQQNTRIHRAAAE